MLAAINPANQDLFTNELPLCHSQGELLYLIENNNIKEVFIDPQLPGHLSVDAFVNYLKTRFPEIEISIVGDTPTLKETEVEYSIREVSKRSPIPAIITVAVIQLALNLILQYSSLTIRQIVFFSIAGVISVVLCLGGLIWTDK